MKNGSIVLGVLAGLATGAVLGILFAPDKGTETRKKIIQKGDDYLDTMKTKFNEVFERFSKSHNGQEAKKESAVI